MRRRTAPDPAKVRPEKASRLKSNSGVWGYFEGETNYKVCLRVLLLLASFFQGDYFGGVGVALSNLWFWVWGVREGLGFEGFRVFPDFDLRASGAEVSGDVFRPWSFGS